MRRAVPLLLLLAAAPRLASAQQANPFSWPGTVPQGQTIEIKGVTGSVHAETATGGQVEVTAVKRARRSDPNSVTIQVVPDQSGSVTICAMYPPAPPSTAPRNDRPNECRPGDAGHLSAHENDVQVDFTVRVPPGVRFSGRTVN